MPEEIDLDTGDLVEQIQHQVEPEGGRLLRRIALVTAVFAALAAIGALQASSTVNEALVLRAEAMRSQLEAVDTWALFQAKGIKAAVAEASRHAWLAAGKEPPPDLAEREQRFASERAEIEKKATEAERKRDEKLTESDNLLHRHHRFADAVALLQVAIALGAVAALTRVRGLWFGSLLVGAVGTAFLIVGALR
jgi:hypothetical protein